MDVGSDTANPYQQRLNRVLNHVQSCLEENLPLERLAEVACLSSFHFHRIFKAMMGETVHAFVRRMRLERAAKLMRASPRARVLDIAVASGFASASDFSRSFKQAYGFSPSRWDRRSPLPGSKVDVAPEPFPRLDEEALRRQGTLADIELTTLPASHYIYSRVHNAYGNQALVDAYHRLIGWLRRLEIDYRDVVMVGMSPDDPEVTPAEKFRYDLGVLFPEADEDPGILGQIVAQRGAAGAPGRRPVAIPEAESYLDESFSQRRLEASRIVAHRVDGDLGDVERMWQVLYRHWLPNSSYQPSDAPAMELFVELPEDIGWQRFDLYGGILIECLLDA